MKMRTLKHHVKRMLGDRKMKDMIQLDKFASRSVEMKQLYRVRLSNIVDVSEPLVLLSQIARSGGTLLSQLFDGHPECYSHPYELTIGYPKKFNWPDLDLGDSPKKWFDNIFEKYTVLHFVGGYNKYRPVASENADIFPFLLLPNLLREIFIQGAKEWDIKNQRDILNCYMTAYFNAWVDYQGFYLDKKYVVAFSPRVNMHHDSIERFFRDYPEGRLISLIRDPKSWYVSAHRHSEKLYPDTEVAMAEWKKSADAMLAQKEQYGNKVFLGCFEKLLSDTEGTMRRMAEFLGITFTESLITPTFQGMPIKANSSFSVKEHGIIKGPADRKKELASDDASYIEKNSVALYEKVLTKLD